MKMNREQATKNRRDARAGKGPALWRLLTGTVMVGLLAAVIAVGLPRLAWATGSEASNSTLAASPTSVAADGVSYSTVTVTLIDSTGQVMSGRQVYVASKNGGSSVVTPSDALTNSSGQATFDVTDTTAETVTYAAVDYTASPNVEVTQTATVSFTPPPGNAGKSTVTANPASVAADGTSYSTITVTLNDAGDHPVSGKTVTLAGNSGSSSVITPASSGSNVTNSSGVATFTVTDTVAETVYYTATDTSDSVTVTPTAQVAFTPLAYAGLSTLTASPTSVTADGTNSSTLTVTLKNVQGNVVSGRTVALAGNSGSSSVITPASSGSNVTNGSGQATFTVTDTVAETVYYTATDTSDGVTLTQTAPVTFTPNVADAGQSTLAVDQSPQFADGTSYSTVTVTLNDAVGNPATGKTVTLAGNSGSSSVITPASSGSNVTNSSGVATFHVTDTVAETVYYTATDTSDSPNVTVTQTLPVWFTGGPPDASKCTFTVTPARVAADGTSAATLTGTVYDAQGRPVGGWGVVIEGLLVGSNSPVQARITPAWLAPGYPAVDLFQDPVVLTNSDGTFTASITDTVPEEIVLKGLIYSGFGGGYLRAYLPTNPTVTFYSPVDAAQSTVTASPTSVSADGTSNTTVTVTLRDAGGNAVAGQAVTLAADSTHSMITTVKGTTDNYGRAIFTVADTEAETVTYAATDATDHLELNQTAQVTFTPDPVNAQQSTVTASPASVSADGTSEATIAVNLVDAAGFPVSGRTVSLTAGSGSSVITTVGATTNSGGRATFTVTDTEAETVTYTATDRTDNVAVDQKASLTFVAQTGVTPAPAIDTPVVAGATSVSGTAQAGAAIELTVDSGTPDSTTAGAGGSWTISVPALSTGDNIAVTAQAPGEAVSPVATTTVQAALVQTPAPAIDTPVSAGAASVSGTAQAGAAIKLTVDSGSPASTTAGADGHWTVAGLTLSAGDTIAVTAQASGESVSPAATASVAGGGSGTQNDPYLIGNAAQLAAIRNTVDQSVYYRLTADIDLGGVAWTPLGTGLVPFAGHFDGQGHVISNLTVTDPTGSLMYSGLFGATAAGSTVANVGIRNVSLYEEPANGAFVGGLVGQNGGSITNSYVAGGGITLTGAGPSANLYAGGLVGQNGADFINPINLNNTSPETGSITDSYATDSVSVQGQNNGYDVGGLVGFNYGSNVSITDSYATGRVSVPGGGYVGGLVGVNWGSITGSYYDGTTTGQSGGETDSQMKQQATFSGWDFTNTWGIHEGLGYPYLLGAGQSPVTVAASPSVGGAVYGGGPYNVGDQATVYAAANNGYTFTGWSDGSGNTVSGSVYYSFTVGSSPVVLVADFTGGTPTPTPTPTIVTPVPAGVTSVSGTAQPGASIILSVNGTSRPAVNAGASGAWTVSVPALSAGDSISVTAQAAGETVSPAQTATVVQATQTPIPAINTPVYDWATSIGGTAQANAAIELTLDNGTPYSAAVDTGGNWTVGGLNLFAGETIAATAQSPGEAVSPAVTTTVLSQTPAPVINTPVYAGAGSVSGTAAPDAGIALSVSGSVYNATASAAGTWTVSGLPALTAGDIISATAQSPGATVSPAQTTTVVGQAAPQTPAPTVNTPVYSGATSANGTAAGNATVTLSVNGTVRPAVNASANGYWTVGGLTLNTGDIIAVTAQAPGETVSPTATAVVAAGSGGLAISPAGGAYAAPLSVTISDSGLSVGQAVYYSSAGDPESVTGAAWFTTSSTNLTLNAPATVCARVYGNGAWGGQVSATYNVSSATYPLTVQASPAADGTVSGGGAYPAGARVPLTATTNSGYKFVNWTDGTGSVVSSIASFNYTLPATSAALTANFTTASQTNTLTVQASPAADGTVTGGGTYPAGAIEALSATANSGYTFVDWTDTSGNVVSFSASFNYTMPANSVTLTANFQAAGPTSMTISSFAVTNRQHQAVTGVLTHGGQYYVSMTVQSTSTTVQTPMLLIQALQGGQVIALNSVQTQLASNGSATVSAMFTPQAAGTVTLEFFSWSNWTDLGGQALAIEKQASEGVQ